MGGNSNLIAKKISNNRFLHKDDSEDGDNAPLEDVPCFLPVVPRMTSCKPDLFQHIEYPHVKVDEAVSECRNSFGGIGAGSPERDSSAHSTMVEYDHVKPFSSNPLQEPLQNC